MTDDELTALEIDLQSYLAGSNVKGHFTLYKPATSSLPAEKTNYWLENVDIINISEFVINHIKRRSVKDKIVKIQEIRFHRTLEWTISVALKFIIFYENDNGKDRSTTGVCVL